MRTGDVPAPYLTSINAGVQESSLANARKYVNNLKAAQRSTQTTTPPPTTTTTTTTTTTVPVAPTIPTTCGGGHLMEKRIRRLGVFMVLCFVALFLQLNNIQVLKANSLANSPQQPQGDPG